jgi:hypothetical protein
VRFPQASNGSIFGSPSGVMVDCHKQGPKIVLSQHFACGIDAASAVGQLNINQGKIGVHVASKFNGFMGIGCNADDFVSSFGQMKFHSLGHKKMVFNKKQLHGMTYVIYD